MRSAQPGRKSIFRNIFKKSAKALAQSPCRTGLTLSRFSAGLNANPPFAIHYLTKTPLVAQIEIGALAGDPLVVGGTLIAPGSFAVVHVKVVLQQIADLTLVSQQDLIETNAQELTGDWRRYQHRRAPLARIKEHIGTAPTQDLGEALFAVAGIEGFRALSAKLAYHRNLIVFPDKMFKGSHLEFLDASEKFLHVIDGKVSKTAGRGRRP